MITVSGIPVRDGSISMPARGRWHADLRLDTDDIPATGSPAVIDLDGYGTLTGTYRRTGGELGIVSVQIVGGAGGLERTVQARYYSRATARVLALDVLTECGETLSSASDSRLGSLGSAMWARDAVSGGVALDSIATAHGLSWWVADDGSVVVGSRTWAADTADYEITHDDPAGASRTLASDALTARPGTTIGGIRVGMVRHEITPESIRSVIYADRSEVDSARGSLAALVRAMSPTVDYLAMYPARVVAQSADLSLDVQPDSDRIPPMTGVPLRRLAPQVEVRVQPGARVLVGFESGDPALPYAALWQDGSLVSVAIAGTTDAAALASRVLAELQAIQTALTTHVHSGVTTGPGTSGTAAPVYTPSAVASTRLLLGG